MKVSFSEDKFEHVSIRASRFLSSDNDIVSRLWFPSSNLIGKLEKVPVVLDEFERCLRHIGLG